MMLFFKMVYKSARQHFLSSILACLSIAVSIALLVSTISLRDQTHANFTRIGHGIDAVLGPKGSPLQIVLNSIYHVEEMPGKIKWSYFKKVAADPLVETAIPFCTGHSFGGFRVNAIEPGFFSSFEFQPDRKFSFAESEGGRGKNFVEKDEAVVGSAVARELGFRIGSRFIPVCGVNQGDPVHDEKVSVVGILAPTGTPYDRAIYMPLKTFYSLSGHGKEVSAMTLDEDQREISGAYIKLKRIRNNAMHPGVQGLKYNINQSSTAQLVIPNEVLPKLFNIIGWIDSVLLMISTTVGVMSMLFLFSLLLNSISARRRDIALLRFLGATKTMLFSVVVGESIFLTMVGTVAGYLIGHLIVYFASVSINIETGIRLTALYISPNEILVLPAVLITGILAGIIPAIMSYRIDIIKNLRPIS